MTQEEFEKLTRDDLEKLKFVLDANGKVCIRGFGVKGDNGNTVLNGSVDPTTEGVDGDFYINITSWQIFGPKSGTWGTGTNLKGQVQTVVGGSNISIDNTDPNNPIINYNGELFSTTLKSKLDGIEAGAEVNNISDINATDLTDGGDTSLHSHDGRYYTETETDNLLNAKANLSGATFSGAISATNLSGTNTGDQTITTGTVTATGGQTVVTVGTYVIGNNKLQVFVNGLEQLLTTDYTETSTTSITFTSGLTTGDIIKYRILS